MRGDFDEDEYDDDGLPFEFAQVADDNACADCGTIFSGDEDVCGVCGAAMCFACFEMGAGVCMRPHK